MKCKICSTRYDTSQVDQAPNSDCSNGWVLAYLSIIIIILVSRALCGVVESQCWLCFDKAEDLRPEILSSLAQQIQSIQHLYRYREF